MNRPVLHVKTPGVTPEQVAAEEAALDAAVSATADIALEPQVAPAAPADLKSYIDEQIAKGVAAGVREIKRAQLGESPKAAVLPDQSDVNVDKIEDMVLSKQGYVIPRGYGKVPSHIAAQIQLGQVR